MHSGGLGLSWITTPDGRTVRQLDDGQVLHVQKRWYNTILTLSRTAEDDGWLESW